MGHLRAVPESPTGLWAGGRLRRAREAELGSTRSAAQNTAGPARVTFKAGRVPRDSNRLHRVLGVQGHHHESFWGRPTNIPRASTEGSWDQGRRNHRLRPGERLCCRAEGCTYTFSVAARGQPSAPGGRLRWERRSKPQSHLGLLSCRLSARQLPASGSSAFAERRSWPG
ncbi:Macrosialin [Manis pentadactyla]|nr:Macrosialin [Manis pentadactyla]